MATDVRLSVGDGDVTDDQDLNATGFVLSNGSLSAPPAPPGQRWRIISWVEDVRGSDSDNLWARLKAIQDKLGQGSEAAGAYGHGSRVTLSMKMAGATNYVYADVVGGVIDLPSENWAAPRIDSNWLPYVVVSLICEPYLRGTAVTTTVSGTITAAPGTFATPGNTGSGGLFVADIPGDVPALCRHILTDVSTGSQITQRYRISAFSRRDPAAAYTISAYTPWVDDTPAGAGVATVDATAAGSAGSQITLTQVMRRIASYTKPAADLLTGLFDVFVRVKDSNVIVGPPVLTAAGVQNDVAMYVRQVISTEHTTGATSLTPTWERETLAGSTLLIGVGIPSRTITITTPSGFTASAAAVAHGTGTSRVAWFVIEDADPRLGSETVAFSSSVIASAVMFEVVGGTVGGTVVDREITATSTTSTVAIASGALAQAREMVFAIAQSNNLGSSASFTSGFTDAATVVANHTTQNFIAGYARSTSTTGQTTTLAGNISSDLSGALISLKQAANLAVNLTPGNFELAVVGSNAGGTSLSPSSNVIAVTVTQTDSVIFLEWESDAITDPDHWRLYFRPTGGAWEYHETPAASGAIRGAIIPDDIGTAGDPPTTSSNSANVRLAVALLSGTTVYNTPSVETVVGSSTWEWLYVATVPLPPMPAIDGGSPRSWICYVEGSHAAPSGTLDADCAVFIPHPVPSANNRHYVESTYIGLDLATLRAHKIETRRDGRTFGYITATGGDTEAGQLSVYGDSLSGPGDTWFTVVPDVALGASDVVNTKYTHQVVYTPRYIWLRGA